MSSVETTTDAAAAAPPSAPAQATNGGSTDLLIEVDGKLVPNYDATIKPFEEGDVVSGEVVRIDKDEVLVDIGYKSEGVIPANELSIRRSVDPSEEVSLGEQVDALVLTKEDQEGRLVLSKKRARFEKAWRKIEAAAESGEPVEGTVIEVVKGGLILDLGVRGFLPASLVDIRRVHNLDEFKGQTLECKVIELNRSRNNVVLSRRAVLEEERKEVREQILGRLQPGMVVEGKISNIVDFGAFVDLEGIDGLIHISELSWSHVNHPSEVLSIGETVRVKVLDIDRDRQRISLGLKQTQEDPWQTVLNEYKPNDILEGKVTKVVAFGAFVEIVPGVEGLVHISELAEHHVETPGEVVQPGPGGLGADPRDRRGAPPDLAQRQARPAQRQPAAARPDPAGASARRRSLRREPEAGVPDLDLSEEVFSEAPAGAGAKPPRRRRCPIRPSRSRRRPSPRPRKARPWRARRRTRPPTTATSSRQPPERSAVGAAPFIGLTGAIAAGKSEALAALDRLGAATLSSDAVVHELLDKRARARSAGRALGPDGGSERGGRPGAGGRDRLRAPRGARLARVGPPPARRGANRARGGEALPEGTPLAVVEVPLLFETGLDACFDATIAIVADDATRAERAGERGTDALEGRAARQLSQDGEGRPGDLRDPQRRHSWTSSRRALAELIADAGAPRRATGLRRRGAHSLIAVVGDRGGGADRSIRSSTSRGGRRGHAAAAPRGHHPPAGRALRPRPGADRGGDQRGIRVQRPDLARRGAGADADHARHRRHDRDPQRRRDVRLRRPRRTPTSTSATGRSTCATCSTASTATRWRRSPPTTAGPENVDGLGRRRPRAGRHRVPRDSRLRRGSARRSASSTATTTPTSWVSRGLRAWT